MFSLLSLVYFTKLNILFHSSNIISYVVSKSGDFFQLALVRSRVLQSLYPLGLPPCLLFLPDWSLTEFLCLLPPLILLGPHTGSQLLLESVQSLGKYQHFNYTSSVVSFSYLPCEWWSRWCCPEGRRSGTPRRWSGRETSAGSWWPGWSWGWCRSCRETAGGNCHQSWGVTL